MVYHCNRHDWGRVISTSALLSDCSLVLLYIDALSRLVAWFFALGHTNYARWIPVHLLDMVTLATKHPSVYVQFLAGNFTVKKTTHAFSAIAIDQAHKQNNALVKGDGKAVGLTENPAALHRWMASGPEMARVIAKFQALVEKRMKKSELKHHEQTKHMQIAFTQDVKALAGFMEEMGNPFCDDSKDLLVLDSRASCIVTYGHNETWKKM